VHHGTTFRAGMHNVLVRDCIPVTIGNLNLVIEKEDGGGKNEGSEQIERQNEEKKEKVK
jgi:hypothetical protein